MSIRREERILQFSTGKLLRCFADLFVHETNAGKAQPRRFAETTLERFANPFLEHRLTDIALHHDVKLETRLAPTRREFRQRFGKASKLLDEILGSQG